MPQYNYRSSAPPSYKPIYGNTFTDIIGGVQKAGDKIGKFMLEQDKKKDFNSLSEANNVLTQIANNSLTREEFMSKTEGLADKFANGKRELFNKIKGAIQGTASKFETQANYDKKMKKEEAYIAQKEASKKKYLADIELNKIKFKASEDRKDAKTIIDRKKKNEASYKANIKNKNVDLADDMYRFYKTAIDASKGNPEEIDRLYAEINSDTFITMLKDSGYVETSGKGSISLSKARNNVFNKLKSPFRQAETYNTRAVDKKRRDLETLEKDLTKIETKKVKDSFDTLNKKKKSRFDREYRKGDVEKGESTNSKYFKQETINAIKNGVSGINGLLTIGKSSKDIKRYWQTSDLNNIVTDFANIMFSKDAHAVGATTSKAIEIFRTMSAKSKERTAINNLIRNYNDGELVGIENYSKAYDYLVQVSKTNEGLKNFIIETTQGIDKSFPALRKEDAKEIKKLFVLEMLGALDRVY